MLRRGDRSAAMDFGMFGFDYNLCFDGEMQESKIITSNTSPRLVVQQRFELKIENPETRDSPQRSRNQNKHALRTARVSQTRGD
jgi:hypothetical protein